MRVLAANKFYFVKGGAERYLFELTRILEERGHSVVPFAMDHPQNEESEHSDLFVSHFGFDARRTVGDLVRTAVRVVHSVEARRKIGALVERTRPDVAHLHNIAHQLSPSILYGLKNEGVPIVQTLHDHKLICPNYQMFVHGQPCERCAKWRYYNACVHRCMHGSIAWSCLVAFEAYARKLLGTYRTCVDAFIAPSRSLMKRMIAHGVEPGKIVHLPYAIALESYEPRFESDGYAVYVGRLSSGKGLETLLEALALSPGVVFKVIGDGPLADDLKTMAEQRGLRNVEFVGYKSGTELRALLRGAQFAVVPSECYENSPLAVYEACAYGKAVIGSSMGGIPELIVDGETGLIFSAGDADELAEALAALWNDRERSVRMGKEARRRAEREYGPDRHYEQIMSIYERVTQ
jgi:glycosyltransferase involved in cell wall biosynthesis